MVIKCWSCNSSTPGQHQSYCQYASEQKVFPHIPPVDAAFEAALAGHIKELPKRRIYGIDLTENPPKISYTPKQHIPTGAQERKATPLWTGLFKYFPDALVAVAQLSHIANEQHNPGQPVHWDRSKSTDQKDTLLRHLLDSGSVDADGVRHSVKVAWRALADAQLDLENAQKAATHEGPDGYSG